MQLGAQVIACLFLLIGISPFGFFLIGWSTAVFVTDMNKLPRK
jgi:hypothetical protein